MINNLDVLEGIVLFAKKNRSYNSEVHWITAVKTDRWPTLKHILLNHSSAIIFYKVNISKLTQAGNQGLKT